MFAKRNSARVSFVAALLLAACLFAPSLAWATIEGDQTPASDAEIQQALENGEILSVDPNDGISPIAANGGSSFARSFSGSTRFDTAAMIAREAYSSSEWAVIAADGGWPDALAGASLAGLIDCPVLITEKGGLSAAARSAVEDLGVRHAIVLGGDLVISDRVAADLRGMGVSVERLAGDTRQDTQMMVYEYGRTKVPGKSWSADMAVVTSGHRFPDALSFSPVAFREKAPIFLVDADGDLRKDQKQALREGGFSKPVVLGGPIVMSDETKSFASSLSKGAVFIAGATQYDTSADIAAWSVSNAGLKWDGAAFTTGYLPYDALTGSVLQGKEGSVVLVVDASWHEGVLAAAGNRNAISSIKFFGGELAIPMQLKMAVVNSLGHPYASLDEYKVYIDAGHGQNDGGNGVYDPGACYNGYEEATLTRNLANRVGAILRNDYGIDVFVNNDGGYYKYRQAEAEALGCGSLVSIHFNAGGGSGSESYIHSYNAAENSSDLQRSVHPALVDGLGLRDRGMHAEAFAVVGGSVSATLLEICFIDNASDMRTFEQNQEYLAQQIAASIAKA